VSRHHNFGIKLEIGKKIKIKERLKKSMNSLFLTAEFFRLWAISLTFLHLTRNPPNTPLILLVVDARILKIKSGKADI